MLADFAEVGPADFSEICLLRLSQINFQRHGIALEMVSGTLAASENIEKT